MPKVLKLVWLGKGVFTRDGKTYKNGDIMPDGIDPKELESLKKKGKVGNPVKAVDISETTALVEAQKKLIKELQSDVSGKSEIIVDLENQISEKNQIISNLEQTSQDKAKKSNES